MYTPTKTLQEAFDLMLSTMRAQNWVRSVRNFGGGMACAYRGDGGLKCAAGALISNASAAIADAGDEFGSWSVTADEFLPLLQEAGWPSDNDSICMYRDFQVIHDETCGYFDDEFFDTSSMTAQEIINFKERRCADLAREYQLHYTPRA